MVPMMVERQSEVDSLLARAAAGDTKAWGALLTRHDDRLRRMVEFRLDPRLRGRVDADDVVQEVYLQAADHREDYFPQSATVPLFLWLRGIAGNKLLEVHRHHLGTDKRDAAREVHRRPPAEPGATSASIAALLAGHSAGPGTAAAGAELRLRLEEALAAMDPVDREALALRHFEQLTYGEAATVLGITKDAAAKRYVRALRRLKDILAAMPGGLSEVRP
jgi:RNA polymerase sigma-70 factor (ECF subfamily)